MPKGYDFAEGRQPLNAEERAKVVAAADRLDPIHQMCIYLYLFTGLRSLAGRHILGDMVDRGDDGVVITLPTGSVPCKSGGNGSKKNDWSADREPCQYCSDTGGEYTFRYPRRIPVRNDEAAETLYNWFNLYDSQPSSGTIKNKIDEVGREAGVDRITPDVLRHSFGVILAEKAFSVSTINKLLGIAPDGSAADQLFHNYARIADRVNPYICGAETSDTTNNGDENGTCTHTVYNPDERCQHHSGPICGAVDYYGDKCQVTVSEEGELCGYHREDE